jgi:hypothetical protein
VSTNFEIIRFIVEYEQCGSERAEYGKKTLPELSNRLTAEFGRGFSHSNLENMRRFYPEYCKTEDQISQTRLGYSLENVKHLSYNITSKRRTTLPVHLELVALCFSSHHRKQG